MKYLLKTFTVCALVVVCAALAGCTVSLGEDGRDGQDVSIYEIWEAIKKETNDPDLTFVEFVSQYLGYNGDEVEQMTSLQAAINRSLLSSVQVTATFSQTSPSVGGNPFWQPDGEKQYYVSQGSGVIVGADRDAGDMYVVTNCHVVYSNDADERYSDDVAVYLYGRGYSTYVMNGNNYLDDANAIPATVIGASLAYDIAVLKVENSAVVRSSDVIAAEWNEDETVHVGQTVYAIGNAAGSGISATNGIVCVDSEEITLDMYDTVKTDDDFTYRTIRTSVPIYSGNSGGGLFDSDGRLIGIINSKTTAASSGEYSDNISHALPAANVRRVVQSMIDRYSATGSATFGVYRAKPGVSLSCVSSEAYMNNQTNLVEITETVEISYVGAGLLADGGLQVGDRVKGIKITSADGTVKEDVEITRAYMLDEVLISAREGDTVCVTVARKGEENPVTYPFTVSSSDLLFNQ